MRFCQNCGTAVSDDSIFCSDCGSKLEAMEQDAPIKERKEETPRKLEITKSEEQVKQNIQSDNTIIERKNSIQVSKTEPSSFWVVLLLILFFPYLVGTVLLEFLYFLPEFIWIFLLFALPIVALVVMWKKRSWNIFAKLIITAIYIILFLI